MNHCVGIIDNEQYTDWKRNIFSNMNKIIDVKKKEEEEEEASLSDEEFKNKLSVYEEDLNKSVLEMKKITKEMMEHEKKPPKKRKTKKARIEVEEELQIPHHKVNSDIKMKKTTRKTDLDEEELANVQNLIHQQYL